MNWLPDTNACIRFLNGRSPKLTQRVLAAQPGELVVCSVVKAELYYGDHLGYPRRKRIQPNSRLDS
jgi:tRNA(fMet)-specific endonuclease VapC